MSNRHAAILALLAACRMHGDAGDGSGSGVPAPAAARVKAELGMPIGAIVWSDDGRFVVFTGAPRDYESWPNAQVELVVDVQTHHVLVLDRVSWFDFAPDHAHLVVIEGDQLAVYDPVTGALVGPRVGIIGAPVFAPDGRIAWAEQAGDQLPVHVRAIGGEEHVLGGLHTGETGKQAVRIQFTGDFLVADTAWGIRAWQHDAPAPVVSIDAPIYGDVIVGDDGITYQEVLDEQDRAALRHVELSKGERTPVGMIEDDKVCGAGAIDRFEYIARCGNHRYLVRAPKAYCVWDVASRRVQARIRSAHEEYHCGDDLVWLGDSPPGGPYEWFSARTGKSVREPKDPPTDEHYETQSAGVRPTDEQRAKVPDAQAAQVSPKGDVVAGLTATGRGALWSLATGQLLWESPVPSEIGAIALSSTDLVAVGRAGELWHVDLATRALRTSQLPDCDMSDDAPMTALPDGRAAVPCHTKANGRALRLEGSAAPVAEADDYGWYIATATGSASTTVGWLTGNGILARTLPAGTSPFSFAPAHYGLAFTADGTRLATAEPVKGKYDYETFYKLTIRDAKNQPVATAMIEYDEPGQLVFSPDGARLAIAMTSGAHVLVLDAATGATVDDIKAESGADRGWTRIAHVAWNPAAPTQLAYYKRIPSRVVIHDVVAKRDVAVRPLVRPAGGMIRNLVWSPDGKRLAMLADQLVTLWDGAAPPTTFALAGTGGIEVRADGTPRLLGDEGVAKAMLLVR
ncbi:MAG: WD40 repeat domain-containing protein [Deltaproteobacteria bacterium]|nr:WD40 repeat domain-containing protein [Deltaproteobacteria bacterium]